jgi:hypothetical protein
MTKKGKRLKKQTWNHCGTERHLENHCESKSFFWGWCGIIWLWSVLTWMNNRWWCFFFSFIWFSICSCSPFSSFFFMVFDFFLFSLFFFFWILSSRSLQVVYLYFTFFSSKLLLSLLSFLLLLVLFSVIFFFINRIIVCWLLIVCCLENCFCLFPNNKKDNFEWFVVSQLSNNVSKDFWELFA